LKGWVKMDDFNLMIGKLRVRFGSSRLSIAILPAIIVDRYPYMLSFCFWYWDLVFEMDHSYEP